MHRWEDDDAVPMDKYRTVLVFCADRAEDGSLVCDEDGSIGPSWPEYILAFGEYWKFCGLTPLSDALREEARYELDAGYTKRSGPILRPFEVHAGGLEVFHESDRTFPQAIYTPGEFGATYTLEDVKYGPDLSTAQYV